jgi:hypothetical protein
MKDVLLASTLLTQESFNDCGEMFGEKTCEMGTQLLDIRSNEPTLVSLSDKS